MGVVILSTTALTISELARSIVGALSDEPAIVPNFAKADLPTIAAVMLVAITKGRTTADRVISYLHARGCEHDAGTIRFLLNLFDGRDRRHCLWTRNAVGEYTELDDKLWMDLE